MPIQLPAIYLYMYTTACSSPSTIALVGSPARHFRGAVVACFHSRLPALTHTLPRIPSARALCIAPEGHLGALCITQNMPRACLPRLALWCLRNTAACARLAHLRCPQALPLTAIDRGVWYRVQRRPLQATFPRTLCDITHACRATNLLGTVALTNRDASNHNARLWYFGAVCACVPRLHSGRSTSAGFSAATTSSSSCSSRVRWVGHC